MGNPNFGGNRPVKDSVEHDIVITQYKLNMTISIDGFKLNTKFMDYHPDGIIYKILDYFGIEADVEYIIEDD